MDDREYMVKIDVHITGSCLQWIHVYAGVQMFRHAGMRLLQDIRAIAFKLNREKLVLTTEPLGSVASEQAGMFQLRLVRQSVCHGIPGQPWSVVRDDLQNTNGTGSRAHLLTARRVNNHPTQHHWWRVACWSSNA